VFPTSPQAIPYASKAQRLGSRLDQPTCKKVTAQPSEDRKKVSDLTVFKVLNDPIKGVER
jgi:hypothetical protein